MKKYFIASLTIILLLIGVTCKKQETPPAPQKYQFYSTDFWFVDATINSGYCGWLVAATKSDGSVELYKPVGYPNENMINSNDQYEGDIEVLPETYTCKDGSIDPRPGQGSPVRNVHFINIIDYKLR